MDLLQTYETSCEESEDDDDNGNSSPSNVSGKMMESVTNQDQRIKQSTDFFGIDAEDNSDNSEEEGRTSVLLNVGTSELDVPEGAFWAALTSDELKQARENSTPLISTPDILQSPDDSPAFIRGSNKRHFTNKNEKCVEDVKLRKLDQCAVIEKDSDYLHCNLQKRIFYVHSKVKPAVHSQNRNRPAKSEERHIVGHGGVINRVKWNSSQFSHLFLSVSMDSTVKVWNAWSTGNPCVRDLRHHGKAVKDAEWSADGHNILSSSYDRNAVLADVETGKQICKLDHQSYVTCGKFHPVRRSQVLTGSTNSLFHWDVRTPHTACREFRYKDEMGQIQDVLFSRDGNQFFTCSDMVTRDSADRNIMAWDYDSGVTLSNQIYQERYACTRLKLHPSTGHFLAQSHGGYIALFSVNRPFKMVRSRRFEGHKLLGYGIGFDVSRDGTLVYSGSSDGRLHCYDYQTGKLRHSFDTGLGVCMDVSCHPVLSTTVVGCSWDGSIKVFH